MSAPRPLGLPAIDPDDVGHNPSADRGLSAPRPALNELAAARLNRRGLLGLGAASGAAALLSACRGLPAAPQAAAAPVLRFDAVAKSLADAVSVPPGYTATVLYRLGDPIAPGVAPYRNDGTDDPASCDRRAGDHHDGMSFFGIDAAGRWRPAAPARGLLVMNHEAITPLFLHPTGQSTTGQGPAQRRTDAGEVLREFYLHGVSVVELDKGPDGWRYKLDSPYNRRIHTLTEMAFSGPAAGSDALKTKYSPDGTRVRGTLNNCAHGTTPWGTYLTCEENWAGYFRRIAAEDPNRTVREQAAFKRYGVGGPGRELWATVTPDTRDELYGRWNTQALGASAAQDYRNGHNTYGWVVEIDPFNPASMPKKRTALGRFGHEGACLGPVTAGQPLVWYMGDDARNEYVYKFVSAQAWDPADVGGGVAVGDKYMDDGKLYAARFDADGTGVWLQLALGQNNITPDNRRYAFADAADVLIHARLAADAAGATRMDRPEWTAIHPRTGEVYLTLTNTHAAARPLGQTDAANPRHYNDPKGAARKAQVGNPNGHIVRFADAGGDPAATTFTWDVYLFGARATAPEDVNLSQLSDDNDFSSPDGLWFSQATPGLAWLATDDSAYTDVSNAMLLAAVPGRVGDGGHRTVSNTAGSATRPQATVVARPPGDAGLRRFLVGPRQCEITGLAESGDGRALFVNIQHPGESTPPGAIHHPARFASHWPDGGTARPRSATIVITRDDGGVIGA